MENYTITRNAQYNSVEIAFAAKPAQETRDTLKKLGFRWHGVKKVWYGYKDAETVRASLAGGAGKAFATTETAKPAPKTKPAGTPQNHIRFYWNGLKVDGGKLIKCGYSLDNNADGSPSVSIYVHDCSGNLPRDLFDVRNDTDIYTDYFDNDSTYLTPAHPLYRYARYVAEKSRARYARASIERMAEQLKGREPWAGHFDVLRADIARNKAHIASFEALTDPGQPTAEDLAEIDRQRQEAENARREAEHQEDLRRREITLSKRVTGRRLIKDEVKAAPIEDGAPVVLINWSEHPAFYDWADDSLRLSVKAADRILRQLDAEEAEQREGGYFKTKFTVSGSYPNGEIYSYQGRYDLGDGDGGLLEHIRAWGEWCRTHDTYGHELPDPPETSDELEFAEYLRQYIA